MKAVARRLLERSYAASKQVALLRMRGTEPPVVVFSMGKTGSTAVARAVQDATGRRVFQVFRLEPTRLREAESRYRESRRRPGSSSGPPLAGAMHLWESEHLLRHPPTAAAPWTVITTVREPIAQALSAFFHAGGRRGITAGSRTADDLRDELVSDGWVRAPLRWFDREFAPALGIDVFSHPFDPCAGHLVIETPEARVLLLRQESLDAAPAALAGFLGLARPVAVPTRNEAAAKEYAGRYRAFLDAVRMSDSVLDEAYHSRYATHFYADSEVERFRRRWARE